MPDSSSLEDNLQCPVAHAIFKEPVILYGSGITVEKDIADKIFKEAARKNIDALCPITRKKITGMDTNYCVKNIVERYLDEHPDKRKDQYKRLAKENSINQDHHEVPPPRAAQVEQLLPDEENNLQQILLDDAELKQAREQIQQQAQHREASELQQALYAQRGQVANAREPMPDEALFQRLANQWQLDKLKSTIGELKKFDSAHQNNPKIHNNLSATILSIEALALTIDGLNQSTHDINQSENLKKSIKYIQFVYSQLHKEDEEIEFINNLNTITHEVFSKINEELSRIAALELKAIHTEQLNPDTTHHQDLQHSLNKIKTTHDRLTDLLQAATALNRKSLDIVNLISNPDFQQLSDSEKTSKLVKKLNEFRTSANHLTDIARHHYRVPGWQRAQQVLTGCLGMILGLTLTALLIPMPVGIPLLNYSYHLIKESITGYRSFDERNIVMPYRLDEKESITMEHSFQKQRSILNKFSSLLKDEHLENAKSDLPHRLFYRTKSTRPKHSEILAEILLQGNQAALTKELIANNPQLLGQAIIYENLPLVKALLDEKPNLLLRFFEVKNEFGRVVTGTPWQLALGRQHGEMCQLIAPYFSQINNGEIIKEQQSFIEQQEGGMGNSSEADIHALKQAMNAISRSKADKDCKTELDTFKAYLKQVNFNSQGKHFKVEIYKQAWDLFKNYCFGDRQSKLFKKEVIAEIKQYWPRHVLAQNFTTSNHYIDYFKKQDELCKNLSQPNPDPEGVPRNNPR